MKKRILAVLLALCMALSVLPVYSMAADEGTPAPKVNYIKLGIPEKGEDGTTYTFPDMALNGSGNPIAYANIAFSSAIASGDTISLTGNDIFSVTTENKGGSVISATVTANGDNNPDSSAWLEFLRENLSVTLNSDAIEYAVTITCSDNKDYGTQVSGYLYRASTNHYYKFFPQSGISWNDAYKEARKKELFGMKGYLITITSQEEQDYVRSIVTGTGWIGGNRYKSNYPGEGFAEGTVDKATKKKNKKNLAVIGIESDDPTVDIVQQKLDNGDAWFWADGTKDEVGLIFYPYMTHNSNANNFPVYSNWDDGEPNNMATEWCTHFLEDSQWNDYSNTNSVAGYFVEFGGKEDDKLTMAGERKTAYISPAKAASPIITSKFPEEPEETEEYITTLNGEKVTPNEFALAKKQEDGSYLTMDELDGIGKYKLTAGYVDADGNSYYSEKEAEIKALSITIQLAGLDRGDVPTGYPMVITDIEKGINYVAEAPEIPGYTVDKTQKTVNNIKSPKVITFNYTKQEKCTVTVKLEGLAAEDVPAGWPGCTKTEQAIIGQPYTTVAPVVPGYLVDRYAATLDPVAEDTTVTFHYVKEGVGNKGCNVKVVLKDTKGKTLSAEGYATSYVVEKEAGMTLAAPEIPGYTLKAESCSVKPEAEGYTLTPEGKFTAVSVKKNTTVTFVYEKQEEHTVTVTLEGLEDKDKQPGYPQEIKVPQGGSYMAIAPQIKGYTVNKIMDSVDNVQRDEEIVFKYTKVEDMDQYEVDVKLFEKPAEGDPVEIPAPQGFITKYYITAGGGFSLTHPTLNGYTYDSCSTNSSLAPVIKNQTVEFYYTKPKTHTVTIVLKGASLAGYPKTVTVADGEDYTAIAPVINGKKAKTYSETRNDITEDVTITFEYERVKGPSTPKPPEEEPEKSPVGDVLNADDHIRYMVGHASGLFGPEGDLTRAQCAQIFYNLLLDKDAAQRVSFPDVPEDKWYARAIETLAGMNVLQGYNDGTFQPEKSITRAEFTAIAMRFGELDRSGENPFPDVTEDRWYYSDVVGSAKYGWIQGYTDGTFRPEEKISRTEVTYIVNRMLKRTADQSYINTNPETLASFPDVPSSYWGYYSIMEATNAHDHTWKDKAEVWTKIR